MLEIGSLTLYIYIYIYILMKSCKYDEIVIFRYAAFFVCFLLLTADLHFGFYILIYGIYIYFYM